MFGPALKWYQENQVGWAHQEMPVFPVQWRRVVDTAIPVRPLQNHPMNWMYIPAARAGW